MHLDYDIIGNDLVMFAQPRNYSAGEASFYTGPFGDPSSLNIYLSDGTGETYYGNGQNGITISNETLYRSSPAHTSPISDFKIVFNTSATDSDSDGIPDDSDAFPYNPNESADSDGDGVGDNADAFDNDPTETTDSDGDGVGDNADAFPQNF